MHEHALDGVVVPPELVGDRPYRPALDVAHACLVSDASTPMQGGVPLFRDVWRYMLGP